MKKIRLKNPVIHPSEKDIQKAIINYLLTLGHAAWRNNAGVSFGEYKGKRYVIRHNVKGSGDIQGFFRGSGKFFSIEVKNWKGKVSPAQQEYIRWVEGKGGVAFVARDLETVVKMLEKYTLWGRKVTLETVIEKVAPYS